MAWSSTSRLRRRAGWRTGYVTALPDRCCAPIRFRLAAVDWLRGTKVLAWAAIGAPERFFSLLRTLGADLIEAVKFPDHHWLSQAEATALLEAARTGAATLVTTEKDAARLGGEAGTLADLGRHSRPLPVKLQFSPAEAERLAVLVETALSAHRR